MRLLARSNQLLLYLRVHKRFILRLPSRDPCIDAMPDWWCVVSGHGYYECPAELAKTMRRGSRIKAAAWRLPVTRDAEFHFAIAAEIQKCDDEAAARRRFHIDFNKKNGTFGTKMESCPKIKVLQVYRAPDAARFQCHFHDFAMIRKTTLLQPRLPSRSPLRHRWEVTKSITTPIWAWSLALTRGRRYGLRT